MNTIDVLDDTVLREVHSINLRVRVAREIAAVQLADPIVGEARPDADGPGACLVADEADGEIETQTVPAVAIVGYAHGWQLP